jgi:hypothetical protein
MNQPTIRGFRLSLLTRLRTAERQLKVRPTNYQAQLAKVQMLQALELLETYVEARKGDDLG